MTLTIIAGANGSGKTTFALSYAHFRDVEFINADMDANDYRHMVCIETARITQPFDKYDFIGLA